MRQLPATFLLFLTLIFLTYNALATQWFAAYPYTKQVEGQNVIIKSIPFEPFSGSPMKGLTQVFLHNKLLYSVDNYYREPLFASNDGRYLVIVNTFKPVSLHIADWDYNQEVIKVLLDGKPFKAFTLKEVIDTAILDYHSWGYGFDYEAFRNAEIGCKNCREVYGRRVLRTCDTMNIFTEECEKCKRQCDSVKLKKNSIYYVQNNSLFVLTNQNTVVKLDMNTLSLEILPMEKAIPNKENFKPPKIKVQYKKVRYPDKYFKYSNAGEAFFLPKLKNGKIIEEGIAELLCKKVGNDDSDSAVIELYFHTLLITKEGKCDEVYVSISQKAANEKKFPLKYPPDEEDVLLKLIVEQWIMEQEFETKTLPKGFLKYAYSDFRYLK